MEHVPEELRNILAAESAANDGLAYPFLSISIYLTVEVSRGVAFGKWFAVGWLCEKSTTIQADIPLIYLLIDQVILGTVIGAATGLGFSRLIQYTHKKGYVDRQSYVTQYLAFAIFTIGVVRTIGSDDLLAAFAAGTTYLGNRELLMNRST